MPSLNIHPIKTHKEYRQLLAEHKASLRQMRQSEQSIVEALSTRDTLYSEGYSWPIQRTSRFLVDKQYQHQGQINLRERLVCEKTRFNNRTRGAIHVFEQFCKPNKNDGVYLTEQLSPLYQWLVKNYPNSVGSEFVTASIWRNKIRFKIKLFPQKLNHQDLTDLTYPDEHFNFVLSFDCFEHIPDYTQALSEIFRVLKPKGQLLFSVPFDVNADNTLVRASVDEQGETIFHVEPEYHGNPMSKEGSLSYYTFGWDLLDTLKSVGFSEAYALVYWSKKYMYLGGPQLLLCAEK